MLWKTNPVGNKAAAQERDHNNMYITYWRLDVKEYWYWNLDRVCEQAESRNLKTTRDEPDYDKQDEMETLES